MNINNGEYIYEGEFKNNQFFGNGKLKCANGNYFNGIFRGFKFIKGEGKIILGTEHLYYIQGFL